MSTLVGQVAHRRVFESAWEDRMHDLALPLATQRPEGIARCFCGEVVTNPTLDSHIRSAHRLTAA